MVLMWNLVMLQLRSPIKQLDSMLCMRGSDALRLRKFDIR